MATPNYKPLLNSSENLKALLAEQNSQGITSAVFSGNEPVDVLSAKTIFNAAKSAEDIAGVSSITAGTGISVSGATGAVTISSTVTGTLPTQTGNSGKLLTTDGTNSSWTTTPVATSLTGPTATALTLTGGSSGASLVLGSGANGAAAFTLPGSGGITATQTRNGQAVLRLTNASTGTGAFANLELVNSGFTGSMYMFGTGYTTSGRFVRDSVLLDNPGTGGMGFAATNGAFIWYQGGNTEKMRLTDSTGNLLIGTTTDMASTAGGLTVAATGSGATATAVNTGGLRSANFGLSTVSGGASYFGGSVNVGGATSGNTFATADAASGSQAGFAIYSAGSPSWYIYRPSSSSFLYIENAAGTHRLSLNQTTGAAIFTGAVTANGQLIGKGTATNDSAATGYIGEYVSSTVNSNPGVSLTAATSANVTSISITAGDWDISGITIYNPAAATACTVSYGSISGSSAVISALLTGQTALEVATKTANTIWTVVTPVVRVTTTSTITVYLVAEANFSGGTLAVGGTIRARRIR